MSWKKKLLKNSNLCVIVNRPFFADSRSLICAAVSIAKAGASIIQLRDKSNDSQRFLAEARGMAQALKATKSLFIVNDRADIARLADADGVHLGQRDIPIRDARKLLKQDKIIGVSCQTLAEAMRAQDEGADYIGVGPVFATDTKTDEPAIGLQIFRRLQKKITVPIFAIGGINEQTIATVLCHGCLRVAISRAICCAPDRSAATKFFSSLL